MLDEKGLKIPNIVCSAAGLVHHTSFTAWCTNSTVKLDEKEFKIPNIVCSVIGVARHIVDFLPQCAAPLCIF